jgi:hypothetical protein
MTPWEHYREAERMLDLALDRMNEGRDEPRAALMAADRMIAIAQVHATLATVVSWPYDRRVPAQGAQVAADGCTCDARGTVSPAHEMTCALVRGERS